MNTSDKVPPAIELEGVTKDFSVGLRGVKLRAVDGLSLVVPEGEVFGLLGPNGSGKSTTIKVILGLLAPGAGVCRVFGAPGGTVEARRAIGYLPEAPYFYRYLSGTELVRFYAGICGVPRRGRDARVREVIEWVGLGGAAERRVGTYSKGMLQRIGLAQALVHDPRLVILDEPTAGVDPIGAAEISGLILKLKQRGKTVLITSHLLAQIEDVCDRVAILDRGRLILEGEVGELVGRRDRQALVVDKLPPEELAALGQWLAERGRRLVSVEQPRARLDKIFLERVGKAPAGSEQPSSS
ncbi:MAG: ABC transporter ATP-binding protein [Opitutaceae bacterium]|jgi:ABC-2 type transport system ATP-binding protein|nr:ABC transporter ATP-binding protein [Opitutaceae bacterium]